jgi:hypothetical protein
MDIRLPTLVLCGTTSPGPVAADRSARPPTRSRTRSAALIADANHMSPITHPDEGSIRVFQQHLRCHAQDGMRPFGPGASHRSAGASVRAF